MALHMKRGVPPRRFHVGLFLPCLLILAATVFPCAASNPEPIHLTNLVVVSDDNYPPYIFRDASGEVRGILPDQWALWEKKTGVKVDLRAMDWSEARRFMQEGRADVIDTIFLTEERAKLYDFTHPYAQIVVPVYAHRTLGGISDIDSLKGFTIGVKAGDAVIDYLTRRGIDSLKEYPSYEAIILAAKDQEIKVFSVDQPAAVYFLYKHGISGEFRESFVLYAGEFHRAVRKNRADLLSLIHDGFEQISRREYRAIDRKWMGSPFLLTGILSQWENWIIGGLAGVLALLMGNVILGRRVHTKTADLRSAVDNLLKSLAAQQKTEMALRESNELFSLFMRHSPIYTFIKEVTATESRVRMASDNYQKMIGIPVAEMQGKTMEELFPPEFAAKISADDWAVVSKGEVLKLDEQLNGRDYVTIKFPIVMDGKKLLAGYTIDITESKIAEQEKAALQEQLAHAQKLDSVGRLAGGIAHDFNNMLQSILGYTEIALGQVSPGQSLHDHLMEIQKVAGHSANFTRQLLTFASKQAVAPRALNINEAVEAMSGMLRRLIGDGDIHMEWKLARGLHSVMMDPGQFDQIVTNLCINARDAIGKSGHITIETSNVEITPTEALRFSGINAGPFVLISIRDNGCGMTPEIRDRVFEPFFTTKPIGKGTGLGLSIVYGIVKQNGGDIRVDSEPGKGSVFEIYLPSCQAGEQATTEEPAGTGALAPAILGTILLVEDEPAVLDSTRRILESVGHQVIATASPKEALKLFAENKERINLLISDVIMPDMNGPEMVRTLLKSCPNLKYLFISGYDANLLVEQGAGRLDIDCIRKPFSLKTLTEKVQESLSRN
jgi:two-component system cell cycle sensor histidine kinase/response regulator CckA